MYFTSCKLGQPRLVRLLSHREVASTGVLAFNRAETLIFGDVTLRALEKNLGSRHARQCKWDILRREGKQTDLGSLAGTLNNNM